MNKLLSKLLAIMLLVGDESQAITLKQMTVLNSEESSMNKI